MTGCGCSEQLVIIFYIISLFLVLVWLYACLGILVLGELRCSVALHGGRRESWMVARVVVGDPAG